MNKQDISAVHFRIMLKEFLFIVIITLPIIVAVNIHGWGDLFYLVRSNFLYLTILYAVSWKQIFKVHIEDSGIKIIYICRFIKRTKTIPYSKITELRGWPPLASPSFRIVFISNEKILGWMYSNRNWFVLLEEYLKDKYPSILFRCY